MSSVLLMVPSPQPGFLSQNIFFNVFMCACVGLCIYVAGRCLPRSEGGLGSPEAGVTCNCEPHDARNQTRILCLSSWCS